MKLHMKQKVFSLGDRFCVWDEWGNDRWFVEEELFVWGLTWRIYDPAGNEVVCVKREAGFAFFPRFTVTIGGREVARITKNFTFFGQEYEVEGPGWRVEGSFWDHSFCVFQDQALVVSIEKEWLTWGDCYTLNIADPATELLALSVVLAIDSVADDEN